jgi:hypothetical protein
MQYLGIDWSYRRAAWCALSEGGGLVGEGAVPADEDGLARLVLEVGLDVRAVVEMMSGAIWVRDTLAAAGWEVQVAHARKDRNSARTSAPQRLLDRSHQSLVREGPASGTKMALIDRRIPGSNGLRLAPLVPAPPTPRRHYGLTRPPTPFV